LLINLIKINYENDIFIFALCFANFSFAQDQEDRDDSFIVENNKNLFKIDIKEPFLQVAVNVMTLSRQL
jgi:hypothetical protein